VLGALVALLAAGLLAAAATLGWAAAAARRDANGYVTMPAGRYRTIAVALTSQSVDLGANPGPADWAVSRRSPAALRVRCASERPHRAVFIGIAPAGDVDAYLAGVAHDEIARVRFRPFSVEYRGQPGARRPAPPAAQRFWSASASGTGPQTIVWTVRPGRWTLVLMNADATPGIDVRLDAGVKLGELGALATWLGISGLIALLLGVGTTIVGGVLPLEPGQPPSPVPSGMPTSPYPLTLEGRLDAPLSRWLWLVKWLLALPHVVILCFLGIAFAVLTVIAFFAILFTGQYPPPLFETNVGILRWSWRVGFYAYSALGTDRYPPFSLRDTGDPARLIVAYPARWSRGLVLVKWWLLSIPHYLIIGIFTSGGWWSGGSSAGAASASGSRGGTGLLPLLVIFAAIGLLFTGRYPQGIFDLVVGLHRWIYRVITYAALMHDAYPPFRLDLGGAERQ
jgi:hypothetical protein